MSDKSVQRGGVLKIFIPAIFVHYLCREGLSPFTDTLSNTYCESNLHT